MTAEYAKARRHAENTLAEVNRHLDSGKIKNPQHHQMLTDMAEKATRTMRNIDDMENRRPYSDTNIGYNANTSRGDNARSDAMNDAMDAINKILPQIADAYDDYSDDMEARQGVKGTGRGRGRSRRIRVGGYTRRADMDDMDDMDYTSEARMRSEHEHRMNEHEHRMRMHEERMREHEARMAANARGTSDVYPTTPVMPRSEHDDARGNTRSDARSDMRSDNAAYERSNRAGPDMTR